MYNIELDTWKGIYYVSVYENGSWKNDLMRKDGEERQFTSRNGARKAIHRDIMERHALKYS
jgi:hypothetical protein